MEKALSSNPDQLSSRFKGMSLGNEHNKSISFMKDIEGEAVNSTKVDLHSDTASFTESLLQSSIQNAFASPKPVRRQPTIEDTYRVPTAKKAPVQKVHITNESDIAVQNLIKYTNANNRKRRSSSTSRIENLPLYDINSKRSRSPCNPQEIKAVSGTHHMNTEYSETPKTTQPNKRLQNKQQYLSPEPRYKQYGASNRSPLASPTK